MTAKDFLSQAYRLDQRIKSKIEQLDSLNALATRASVTLSDMPKNPNRSTSTMEDTICKIIDLQEEINKEVDRLVDLKVEIVNIIKAVPNPEHQMLLELRYLCFKTWEQIAVDMNYGVRNIYNLHGAALKDILPIKNVQ